MIKPLFAHRPPTTGIHLLSDPQPEFHADSSSFRAQCANLVETKQARLGTKAKKSKRRA